MLSIWIWFAASSNAQSYDSIYLQFVYNVVLYDRDGFFKKQLCIIFVSETNLKSILGFYFFLKIFIFFFDFLLVL